MLKTAMRALPTPLPDLGVLRVQGADSLRFLQGQLSNDTQKLTEAQSQLTGLHTAQGRAIALLRLLWLAPDDVLAVLPRELVAPAAARLSKYVLRAKAKVADASAQWQVSGLAQSDVAATLDRQELVNGGVVVCIADAVSAQAPARWLAVTPATGTNIIEDAEKHEAWRASDIAAGIPQVYAVTSEAFVAQMLNLDVLGGIAFDKGCYTGQEVIARAHYRGRVKRRMQRFRSTMPTKLTPGDSGTLRDGRSFRVVDAVQLSDGRCEFLAVAAFGALDEATENATASPTLDADRLPLPYALPD